MSIKSMTGYGHGTATSHGLAVEVQLTSVNRKQLEVRTSLPKSLSALESRFVKEVSDRVSRGYVIGTVNVEFTGKALKNSLFIDERLASAYVASLRRVAAELGLRDDLTASALLRLPDVIRSGTDELDPDEAWKALRRALRGALRGLVAMRTTEGEALAKDLTRRLTKLDGFTTKIEKLAGRVPAQYAKLLRKRLDGSGIPFDADDPALRREVALFADRCDVSEELTRLKSHLDQARGLLSSTKPVGRALDFLSQELLREINTIGSKANDAQIAGHVVTFKAELERMREQLQNVE
jgi:uncharacterized protein (TIGR00255 family)